MEAASCMLRKSEVETRDPPGLLVRLKSGLNLNVYHCAAVSCKGLGATRVRDVGSEGLNISLQSRTNLSVELRKVGAHCAEPAAGM